MNFNESIQLRKRAEKVIPDGTMTASKAPRRFVQGVSPCYIAWGEGAEVVDVDGNKFIDTAMALGAVILGYADDDVNKAVQRQVDRGSLFTLPGKLEVEVAEELLEHWLPGMDMVRFLKTGSEATSAAVRLARAVTGREAVVTIRGHYHGWHDWTISRTPPATGVPQFHSMSLIDEVEYGDIKDLEAALRFDEDSNPRPTAVIMEPVTTLQQSSRDFLWAARELCDEYGALLIFDEVLTGIRFNPTAYAHADVIPDLVTIGKAMGNGYPIAALAGKREYMERLTQDEDGVFVSGTYNGELVSLAATKATLEKVRNIRTQRMGDLGRDGAQWKVIITCVVVQPLEAYGVHVKGYPLHFNIEFDKQSMADLFQQECMKNGVLYTGNHNISFSHTPGIRLVVVEVYNKAAMVVKKAMEEGGEERCRELLEGEPTKKGFRRQG